MARTKPIKPASAVPAPEAQRAVMREKYIALWAGVFFFATLVIVVWVGTIKGQIVAIVPPAANDSADQWESFLTEFQTGLAETRDSVAEVKDALQETAVTDTGEVRGEQIAVTDDYREKRIETEKLLYEVYEGLMDEVQE